MNRRTTVRLYHVNGRVIFTHTAMNNSLKITLLAAIKAGANLRCLLLKGGSLYFLNGRGLDLEGAIFEGVNLEGVDFKGANLRLALFKNCEGYGTSFEGCNLTNATLRDSSFDYCNFNHAQLEGLEVENTTLIKTEINLADPIQ